ncbi:MAG: hypothetical protein A2538_01820 [Candidatus Magasanikbacteria bacterium RIFOXYD2_FULL_41_14]|uniref:Cation-transporting P-type ATPase N-terminal domain-containing protein n=1 Tax=Candidatus Magasanikbacteria bacterium RIFOXYD2_FULL_41_14 TaxID=1798709 RepID=A0A1F6PE17_9BACT|nr:MAG: hypothetical protein A2538_01820 [Candidatus Magasanikbacteria bacterium RIFOXYD2_FULL_41_14]
MAEFKVDKNGLKSQDVKERLEKYGLNKLSARQTHWWQIFGRQFKSPFIYLLFFAVLLALLLGEKTDGIMILIFIAVNTLIGFTQEYHSERALQLLQKFVVARTHARRDGHEDLVETTQLVPGDLVIISNGDVVPADMRLIQVENIVVDESSLTGESINVFKHIEAIKNDKNIEPHEAANICFSGTIVVSGKGVGVVVATGATTMMGAVARLTVETRRESAFEKGIAKFSRFILRMIGVILILMFGANIAIKGFGDWAQLALFTIALAVSVIPEALPLVTTLSLSRGALRLARKHVVARRLSAVEDLGSIEVLCTDKTGTITENKLKVVDIYGDHKEECLFQAAVASSFLVGNKREPNNSFDLALWHRLTVADRDRAQSYERVAEIPFDPKRRRNDVVVRSGQDCFLVVRGAPESIFELCRLSALEKKKIIEWSASQGDLGRRVIAVAGKKEKKAEHCEIEKGENHLNFFGLIAFEDPIKDTTIGALARAKHLGLRVVILTGDGREVAGAVARKINLIKTDGLVLTGEELEAMLEEKQEEMVEKVQVFARVSPEQKYHIIQLLQKKHEVGFLGEGINDAPALKLANVALVVDGAADIARDAADIVLLSRSLEVIVDGVKNGREIFANTVKYLKITLISNFGNFYAVAAASLLVPYLPMLPVQILLLNLLSDFPMIAIALDRVDVAELRRPRSYDIKEVALVAVLLGLVSTVFDFIFFGIFRHSGAGVLQTNWFIGSVLTELALIYSVRTHFFFLKAKRPSGVLSILCVVAVFVTLALPLSGFGSELFRFVRPTVSQLVLVFEIVALYFVVTEAVKLLYYRFINGKPVVFK